MSAKKRTKKPKARMADLADRHDLYQQSVQCVEAEIDFVDDTYRELRGQRARTLREDFCGTANTSCEWVRRRSDNHAIGVDLDAEVLAWGREHNIAKLGKKAARIALVEDDVLTAREKATDVVLAMNFSYWLFTDRERMGTYFKGVHSSLERDGVFFLDAYGGYDSFRVTKDRTELDNFTYIWDQAEYDPISGCMRCYIHFHFSDGSKLQRAFSYEWRMWSLPEIRELLLRSGFSEVTFYWQGWDEESGEADGVFLPVTSAEPDAAWICYIVAQK